ncbi:MAG: peptidylprolyl isomerase [Calditrichaeota bacterium]|nr:peptidylprolyl isomerase [Calditrichota bacterium]
MGCGKKQAKQTPPVEISAALLNPDPAQLNAEAPDVFKIKFETSKGDFVMEVHRDWSPHGADRLYYLAKNGFYDGVRFFRVIDGFMAQFGYHGDPKVIAAWESLNIPDDPVVQSNKRGYVSFAKSNMPDSRTTQLFINFADNAFLDGMGFSPVAVVTAGMDVVDQLYNGYGEGAPRGTGPNQGEIQKGGNKYLNDNFPKLDYIKKAYLLHE